MQALSDEQIKEICSTLKGKRVRVRYVHNREIGTIREEYGALEDYDGGRFIIRKSETSSMIIPAVEHTMLAIESTSPTSDAREGAEDPPRKPPQPTAERTFDARHPAFEAQLELQKQTLEMMRMMIEAQQCSACERQVPPPPSQGSDVEAMLRGSRN